MPRLIDADKLRKDILDLPNCYNGFSDTYDKACIIDVIDEQPTVDAEPVRHGHWVHGKELSRDYIGNVCVSIHYDKCWCSECDYPVEHPLWMYCPNCGAKMDGESN